MSLRRTALAMVLAGTAVGCRDLVPVVEPTQLQPPTVAPGGPHVGSASFDIMQFGSVLSLGGNAIANSAPLITDQGAVGGTWNAAVYYAPGSTDVMTLVPSICAGSHGSDVRDGYLVGYGTSCTATVNGKPIGSSYAFRWTPTGGFMMLPPIGGNPFASAGLSQAYVVNASGIAAGLSTEPQQPGHTILTRWDLAETPSVSIHPAGVGAYSPASYMFINASGAVATVIDYSDAAFAQYTSAVVVWSPGDAALHEVLSAQRQGELSNGVRYRLWGFNDNGDMVVSRNDGTPIFVLTAAGAQLPVGSLTQTNTSVSGFTNNRDVVGTTTLLAGQTTQGYRWTPSGGVQFLTMPAGWNDAEVNGISPNGLYLTGSFAGPNVAAEEAFRYTVGSGFERLGTVPEAGGQRSRGYAVNDRGDVAGMWFYQGNWAVWLGAPTNRAPTAAIAATGGPFAEGAAVTLSGAGSMDPDNDPLTYTWTFGDGSPNGVTTTPSIAHTYQDNGTYTASLVVSDGKGGVSPSVTTTLAVTNVAPSATFAAPASANEGVAFTLSLSNPTDPSPADVAAGLTYAFNCGTGFGAFSSTASVSCVPADNGTVSVGAQVRDRDGGIMTYTGSVIVANTPPTVTFSPPAAVGEGSTQTLAAIAHDASSADEAAGFTYAFDCGTGAGYGAFTSTPSASCLVQDNGTRTVSVRVRDKDGSETQASTTATVTNLPPTISVSVPSTIGTPGALITVTAQATDPSPVDQASLQYAVNCGTGTGMGPFTSSPTASCTLRAFGTQTITMAVRDKDGAQVGSFVVMQIINAMDVQPGTISLTATGTVSVYLYSTSGFDATLADPATIRLVVLGANLPGALVSTRNGVPLSTVADYNGDGRPDRLLVFTRASLQAAGLTTTRTGLSLEQATGTVTFVARDATAPIITP